MKTSDLLTTSKVGLHFPWLMLVSGSVGYLVSKTGGGGKTTVWGWFVGILGSGGHEV